MTNMKKRKKPKPPDIHAIMGHSSRGLALVIAHRSLDADDAEIAPAQDARLDGPCSARRRSNEHTIAECCISKPPATAFEVALTAANPVP